MLTPSPNAVVVSGVQPSGTLHLGNYFGALRQHLALHRQREAYYFIVNYHALTTVRDAAALEQYSLDVALDYLALGFDPDEAALFLQSDVPAVTELAWILLCLTPVSQLEKGVSYKDKVAQGLSANGGLFTYPVLQAADILIYGEPGRDLLVPVGQDQKQNIEISRDLAQKFNAEYCDEDAPLFPVPEPLILDDVAVVPGIDGQKMSKSYGNTIGIFDEGKTLKKKVMSIVTDSTPLEAPKDPERDNVFALIKLFADDAKREEIAAAYRAGGYGYGHAKKELLALITEEFAEAREHRKELEQRRDYVRDVLRDGAQKARLRADEVMARVREHTGLVTTTDSDKKEQRLIPHPTEGQQGAYPKQSSNIRTVPAGNFRVSKDSNLQTKTGHQNVKVGNRKTKLGNKETRSGQTQKGQTSKETPRSGKEKY